MFIHTVYFWLRRDLSAAERAAFDEGVKSLARLPSVKHGWVGQPADTDRPVIDRTYDYGLTTVFDDKAGHDAYQEHPDHLAFVTSHARKWIRVLIYDHVAN